MRLDDWLAENFGGYGLEVTAAHLIRGVIGKYSWHASDMWAIEVEQAQHMSPNRRQQPQIRCLHEFWLDAHQISVGADLPDVSGRRAQVDVDFYIAYCAEANILYWYQEGNNGN